MTNTNLQATCPVCDVQITLPADVAESEVVTCTDCKSRLVVDRIEGEKAHLSEAPEVEEDWGE